MPRLEKEPFDVTIGKDPATVLEVSTLNTECGADHGE